MPGGQSLLRARSKDLVVVVGGVASSRGAPVHYACSPCYYIMQCRTLLHCGLTTVVIRKLTRSIKEAERDLDGALDDDADEEVVKVRRNTVDGLAAHLKQRATRH